MSHAIAPFLVLLGLVLLVAPVVSVILAVISHNRVAELQRKVQEHEAELEALRSNLTHLLKSQPPSPEAKQPAVVTPAAPVVLPAPPPVIATAPRPPEPASLLVAEKPEEIIEPREPEWQDEAAPPPVLPLKPVATPATPKPSFDWEALLGVRGAAWLGAIAFVIAASLFL
ncbi:MAG: hypothetical protein WC429_18775, partial [Verrucomicrobiia bacterium]